jgi:histidinol-phosphatase (PHP family)
VSDAGPPALVSVHGGHSGEFCSHARDALEDIVRAYLDRGFAWVGITEHMPPASDAQLPPEERAAGLDVQGAYERFAAYFACARALQRKYAGSLEIHVGFEAEFYAGSEDLVRKILREFRPDYVVGSIHHVDEVCIDATPELYARAARSAGGDLDALYRRYFDQQYQMIDTLRPTVVGHLDLIRSFDSNYRERLERPEIRARIRRNLERIAELDLILDFNVRALAKGADEPYVARSILLQALELGISVVPGDDSHSVDSVGQNLEAGIRILRDLGFDTRWRTPSPGTPR